MATKRNGNGNLDTAMTLLIQNQALFVNQMASIAAESAERFARIEKDLDLIKGLLVKHESTLEKLPEAIRKKIGFKAV